MCNITLYRSLQLQGRSTVTQGRNKAFLRKQMRLELINTKPCGPDRLTPPGVLASIPTRQDKAVPSLVLFGYWPAFLRDLTPGGVKQPWLGAHACWVITQQTTTRDFTCSVSEFTSSTGSIQVNSPDSVNKFGVSSTHDYREIMSFSRNDTYQ